MRNQYWILAAAFSLSVISQSKAQISFGGHPYGVDRSTGLPEAPIATMPAVDVDALMAEDEQRMATARKGPYRFGKSHAVELGLENSGVWHTMSNGDRVWRLMVACPGAFSINMEFHRFVIPDGAQVFIYNEVGDVLGGFEAGSCPGRDQLGVDLLAGDRVTVEYVEPARVAGQGQLSIGQVTHGYRDVFNQAKVLGESGSCNNNVKCPEGDPWRPQIRSVAIMLDGGGFCTGQLINNCNNDGTPYFLTANHCLEGTPTNNNFVYRFHWESPQCAQNLNGPMTMSISGATRLYNNTGSDVALLRLTSTPPASYNVFYTGWDRSTSPATTGVVGIHHPAGDVKKISFENQAVTSQTWGSAQCWKVADWDDGTTEGGSSGSGLWNMNGLLIGQLFGGYAACGNNLEDNYGKFAVSYTGLQQWLGSCGTTLQGYPSAPAGTEELALEGSILAWPNPTTGQVTLSLPTMGIGAYQVRVMDAVGRVVFTGKVAAGTDRYGIDLAGEPNGLYLVEARSGGVQLQQRLMLAR